MKKFHVDQASLYRNMFNPRFKFHRVPILEFQECIKFVQKKTELDSDQLFLWLTFKMCCFVEYFEFFLEVLEKKGSDF